MPQDKMTIFLSWSGKSSQAAAQAIGHAIVERGAVQRDRASHHDIVVLSLQNDGDDHRRIVLGFLWSDVIV